MRKNSSERVWSIAQGMAAVALAGILLLISGGTTMAGAAKAMSLARLKQERKKAALRPRRLIFNNDGDDSFCGTATPEALLEKRTAALVGSHVDTITYSTTQSTGLFTHNTKVGEVFTYNAGRLANRNTTQAFIDQGTDNLTIMVDFCHKNNIEILWSMRMNDTHDASPRQIGYRLSKLKKAHPEYLLGSKGKRPRHGQWTGVDYTRPEIRDLVFRLFEEVCQNYDVDGIEMDFFRHPVLFKRHAMGSDCGQAERDMMTGLMRRVRKMTERVGLKRGRPLLVAVRVPDSVGYCAAIGLDLERWLADGLFDILVASGYFHITPWQTTVRLGHEHGVAVLPCLSEPRLRDKQALQLRQSLACYRARAANAWAAGADGVYIFNVFNPRRPLWRQLGDPVALGGMDKVYTTGARGHRSAKSFLSGGQRFVKLPNVLPERPVSLAPGKAATVTLRVGQQPGTVGGKAPEVTLGLRVNKLPDPADLAVTLNGHALGTGTETKTTVDYPVDPEQVKKGINKATILLKPGSEAKPVLQDLLLWVRHRKK